MPVRPALARALILLLAAAPAVPEVTQGAAAAPVRIVAAENVYGDVARQIGGPHVAVTSILSNPDQDPHLFETNVSTARALADADIVMSNGADYDPWMAKLLAASPDAKRASIVAATLVGAKSGDNPHLWYEPKVLPAVAADLAAKLSARDPADAALFKANLAAFQASFAPIDAEIAGLRAAHAGTSVTATEPVFGYMAQALGFTMLNTAFQTAVMNDAEPSASQVEAFEDSLRSGKAKILFYNKQVTDKTTQRLLALAQRSKVPVVGVTETEPAGTTVQAWFKGQLDDVKAVLNEKAM